VTKEEVLAALTKEGLERFNEAVKLFSSNGLLKGVKSGATRIIVLTDDTELGVDDL
jgi:hypothetical protein